ncbi:Histone chaperone asf1 [Coemansia sp. RSA 2708]|nr:Histone chaperone asf1 [Coemansia sp. RSA 2708]
MSLVKILNVNIIDPTAAFLAPYKLEITFECIEQLKDDLEFKLIYVCSGKSSTLDQELESLFVGPVPVGINKFVLEAAAPDATKIPGDSVLDLSVIMLRCDYMSRTYTRIGYYVHSAYTDEALQANPPAAPALDKVQRSILAEKPRVTQFTINWEDPTQDEQPPAQSVEEMMAGDDDEDDAQDEDSDDDDEDEADDDADVDLDAMEAQDEAELGSDADDDDDDEMHVEDDAPSAMPSAIGMEVE